jgi:hypothetical protein
MELPSLTAAASIVISVLLCSAGILKLVDPRPFGWAMLRMIGPKWTGWRVVPARRTGRIVGTIEVSTGSALLILPGTAGRLASVVTAALCLAFVAAVVRAIRRGTSCGCWASFSDGVAAGAELGRAMSVAGIAVADAWYRAACGVNPRWSPSAAFASLVFFIVVVVVSKAVGWLLPSTSKAAPHRVQWRQRPLKTQLATLSGLVSHARGAAVSPDVGAVPVQGSVSHESRHLAWRPLFCTARWCRVSAAGHGRTLSTRAPATGHRIRLPCRGFAQFDWGGAP